MEEKEPVEGGPLVERELLRKRRARRDQLWQELIEAERELNKGTMREGRPSPTTGLPSVAFTDPRMGSAAFLGPTLELATEAELRAELAKRRLPQAHVRITMTNGEVFNWILPRNFADEPDGRIQALLMSVAAQAFIQISQNDQPVDDDTLADPENPIVNGEHVSSIQFFRGIQS